MPSPWQSVDELLEEADRAAAGEDFAISHYVMVALNCCNAEILPEMDHTSQALYHKTCFRLQWTRTICTTIHLKGIPTYLSYTWLCTCCTHGITVSYYSVAGMMHAQTHCHTSLALADTSKAAGGSLDEADLEDELDDDTMQQVIRRRGSTAQTGDDAATLSGMLCQLP